MREGHHHPDPGDELGDDPEYGEIPDHDDDGSYALGYEVVPVGVRPAAPRVPEKTPEKTPGKAQRSDAVKPQPERAGAGPGERTEMDRFRDGCRKASIDPGKPLYMVLATTYRSVLDLKETLAAFGKGAARGLTPEGEADLVQRVVRQVDLSMRESAAKHRLRLGLWTSMAVGAGAVAFLTVGAAGGYWWGWTGGRESVRWLTEDVAVSFSRSAESAEAAAALLRHNDPARVLAGCVGQAVFVSDGRKACSVSIWLEPAGGAPGAAK